MTRTDYFIQSVRVIFYANLKRDAPEWRLYAMDARGCISLMNILKRTHPRDNQRCHPRCRDATPVRLPGGMPSDRCYSCTNGDNKAVL